MPQRLTSLTLLSFACACLALAMPLQIMLLYGHGLSEWTSIWSKLTWINNIIVLGLLVNAILLWQVSPLLKFTVPILLMLVGVNNYIVGFYATDFSMLTTSLGTFGFLLLHIPILDKRVRWILVNPERRWWRRADRYRVSIPLVVEGVRLHSVRAETFDVSESGLFILGHEMLSVGDWVSLKMTFDSLSQVRARARVVRRTEAAGIYPSGVGVEFMDLSWRQRRELRRYLGRTQSQPKDFSI